MNGYGTYGSSEETQPVTWLRGYPIYAAHFVVLVFVTLMIVTAVAGPNMSGVIAALAFTSEQVLSGQVWRLFTYGLFNSPSLAFALDMLMIIWFGRELEKTFGRRLFFLLYAGIYLVPTAVLTLIGLLRPTQFVGQPGAFALFVGFATLFPGAVMMFNVLAKWAAIILFALFSLIALAGRDWITMTLLWSTCGFAYLFVQYQKGEITLPKFRLRRRTPKLRVLPDLKPEKTSASARAKAPAASMAEVDALLDKIAQSGMASLTAHERAKLDAARADLIKRGAGR